jgi:putative peptidoglycan lipid II flippase
VKSIAASTGSRARFWMDSARTSVAAAVAQAPSLLVAPLAAYILGATETTDAAFIALAIALALSTAFSGAAQFAAVPFLVEFGHQHGRSRAMLSSFSRIATSSAAVAAVMVAAGVSGYAAVVDPAYRQAARDTWWLCPFVVLSVHAAALSGGLNAVRDFVRPALSPVWRWGAVLISLVLLGRITGPIILIVGYTVGETLRLGHLAWPVRRSFDPPQRSTWTEDIDRARPFLRAALSQLVGSAVIGGVPILDRFMAASLAPGSASLLEYADRLWQAPVGLVASGFLVVLLADLSGIPGRDPGPGAGASGRLAFAVAAAALVPTALVYWWRELLIGLLFRGGDLTASDLRVLADTFGMFVLGVPTYLAALTYSRIFLAMKRSDWLIGVAVFELAVKLAINPMLMNAYGVPGLAAATSVMYASALVVFAVALPRVRPGTAR